MCWCPGLEWAACFLLIRRDFAASWFFLRSSPYGASVIFLIGWCWMLVEATWIDRSCGTSGNTTNHALVVGCCLLAVGLLTVSTLYCTFKIRK